MNLVDFRNVSPREVAEALGTPANVLFAMAADTDRLYRPTDFRPTAKGKIRELDIPKPYFKHLLKKLHRFIQKSGWYSRAAHGGIRKMSSFTSAACHLGQSKCITRDITDCYPSVKKDLFRKSLLERGFRPDTSRLLSGLLTCRGRIPQGAPTSGDALNLYLWDMDLLMLSHCGKQVSFTRMADDHVLSGFDTNAVESAAAYLERLLQERGLSINEKKQRECGPGLSSQVQVVHSIAVNHPTKTRIPRDRSETWRKLAEVYVGAARSVSAETLSLVAAKRRTLEGYVNYSSQADISPSKHIAILASHGDKFVLDKLRRCGVTRSTKSNWWRNRSRSIELEQRWKMALQPKVKANHANAQSDSLLEAAVVLG